MLGLHFRVCRAMTGHPFKVVKDRSCGVVRDRSACTLEHSMYRKVKAGALQQKFGLSLKQKKTNLSFACERELS